MRERGEREREKDREVGVSDLQRNGDDGLGLI